MYDFIGRFFWATKPRPQQSANFIDRLTLYASCVVQLVIDALSISRTARACAANRQEIAAGVVCVVLARTLLSGGGAWCGVFLSAAPAVVVGRPPTRQSPATGRPVTGRRVTAGGDDLGGPLHPGDDDERTPAAGSPSTKQSVNRLNQTNGIHVQHKRT